MLLNASWSPNEDIKMDKGFLKFCFPHIFHLGFAEDYYIFNWKIPVKNKTAVSTAIDNVLT